MQIVEKDGRRVAVLTKIVRVPVDLIYSVRRASCGNGAVVITDRGCSVVTDDYNEVVTALYGSEAKLTEGDRA